jgi:hypothetical protein
MSLGFSSSVLAFIHWYAKTEEEKPKDMPKLCCSQLYLKMLYSEQQSLGMSVGFLPQSYHIIA